MHADPLPPAPAEVTLALNLQHDTIVLDLLGKRYEDFEIPFTRAEVERALDDASPNRITVDPLVSFGSTLFSALFSAERGRALWERLDQATREHSALRLRILTNVESVQHLPWELLYDASRSDFFALSGRVALVRTRPDSLVRGAVPVATPKLRILAVTADPDERLQTEEGVAALEALVRAHPQLLEIQVMRQVTVAALTKALAKTACDVFVCFGDGAVLPDVSKAGGLRQALQLVPSGTDTGQLKRNDLGQMLSQARVRLALLDGSDTEWVARSLAKHVPSSIGFREMLRPQSRRVVIDALFGALVAGVPLDLAVSATRQAIDRALPGSGDWCRLIFYLQPADGTFLLGAAPETAAVIKPPATKPTAAMTAGVPSAAPTRELARLSRLYEIYRANLDAVTQAATTQAGEGPRNQAADLRDRLADLARQMAAERANREGGL